MVLCIPKQQNNGILSKNHICSTKKQNIPLYVHNTRQYYYNELHTTGKRLGKETLKHVSPPLFWLPSWASFLLSQYLPEVKVNVLCVFIDRAGKWLSQSESVLINSSEPWVLFNSALIGAHFTLVLWYILCSPNQTCWLGLWSYWSQL